jgi:hypothetical protein
VSLCVRARSRVLVLIALTAVGVKGLGKMPHYGIAHVCSHTMYMYPCEVAVTFCFVQHKQRTGININIFGMP